MRNDVSIFVLSENEIAREGLRNILASDGYRATAHSISDWSSKGQEGPDRLAIVDAEDTESGFATCQSLRSASPELRIALMCPGFEAADIRRGVKCGIQGFFTRDISSGVLKRRLSLMVSGQIQIPSQLLDGILDLLATNFVAEDQQQMIDCNLSDREKKVLGCLINGDPDKTISLRLNIAEPTVKVYVKSILRKLKVANRTQAAIWAIRPVYPTPAPAAQIC